MLLPLGNQFWQRTNCLELNTNPQPIEMDRAALNEAHSVSKIGLGQQEDLAVAKGPLLLLQRLYQFITADLVSGPLSFLLSVTYLR